MSSSSNLEQAFGITEAAELFKTDFKDYQEAVYNKDILLWGQIESVPMTGDETEFPFPFGYNGGNSSGRLPAKRVAEYKTCKFSHKKVYAAADVKRDAMAASMSNKGAFVKFMEEPMEKIKEGFTWNMNRILHGNGDGSLGTISAIYDQSGGLYRLTISNMKEANFEEGMFVNIETGNTDLFEITEVDPDNSYVYVQREAGGTQVPSTDTIFMQRSENNDPHGLKEICDATSATKYNIATSDRKWQAYQVAAGGVTITPQLLNQVYLRQQKRVGKARSGNMGLLSYIQYEKLLNQLEDSKRYDTVKLSPKDKRFGDISFSGIVYHGNAGDLMIFPERFVEDDRFYLLNTDFIKKYEMPKSGFVTEDTGKPFLRSQDEDMFEIRWAWYGQLFIVPTYQAVVTGLSTS